MSDSSGNTCRGCGKDLGSLKVAWIELAPSIQLAVCAHGARYGYFDSPPVKESCAAKAREKCKLCRGCGEEETFQSGTLCQQCRALLDRAREDGASNPKDREVVWVAMNLYGMIADTYHDEDLERDDVQEIERMFARAVATGRFRKSAFAKGVPERHSNQLWVIASGGRSSVTTGTPVAETTKRQAKALKWLVNRLKRLISSQYQAGIERGHRNVLRMAAGEIGSAEFDAVKEKAEKRG